MELGKIFGSTALMVPFPESPEGPESRRAAADCETASVSRILLYLRFCYRGRALRRHTAAVAALFTVFAHTKCATSVCQSCYRLLFIWRTDGWLAFCRLRIVCWQHCVDQSHTAPLFLSCLRTIYRRRLLFGPSDWCLPLACIFLFREMRGEGRGKVFFREVGFNYLLYSVLNNNNTSSYTWSRIHSTESLFPNPMVTVSLSDLVTVYFLILNQ